MSGGGLISGVATALKRSRPSVQVVGVEPAGVARMTASLAAGHPVTIPMTPGIADGLLAVRPGDITFRHVQAFVDRVVTIDDKAIVAALQWLFRDAKLVAEPSGAITVAAALADARRRAASTLAARWWRSSAAATWSRAFAKYLSGDACDVAIVRSGDAGRFAPQFPGEDLPCGGNPFLDRRDLAVELPLVDLAQDGADLRARASGRAPAGGGRAAAASAPRAPRRATRARSTNHVIAVQSNSPGAAHAVGRGQPGQQFEIHLLREPAERAVAHLVAHLVPGRPASGDAR